MSILVMPAAKICILAAGRGTRNSFSQHTVKGLLPLDNKPIVDFLLSACPSNLEIVVAVGCRSDLWKEFFPIAYPERTVTFVDVEPFEGPGSGPGYSLLSCRPALEGFPFFLIPTDAVVRDPLIAGGNWIGTCPVSESRSYLLAEVLDGRVKAFYDKDPHAPASTRANAFTGIAHIEDNAAFFASLETATPQAENEVQVTAGFEGLLNKGLAVRELGTWQDVGTSELYDSTVRDSASQHLLKSTEFTYWINQRVVKFDHSAETIRKKLTRADILEKWVPKVERHSAHFFSYSWVPGHILSKELDVRVFRRCLEFMQNGILQRIALSEEQLAVFHQQCLAFYRTKTESRIHQYLEKTSSQDEEAEINGRTVPPVHVLLEKVNWDELCQGIPVLFHGDAQLENIIVGSEGPCLIDWRHEFVENETRFGDGYYDLAKLYHSVVISGEVVRRGLYSFERMADRKYALHHYSMSNLIEFEKEFRTFVEKHRYDWYRIETLAALIYINIARFYDLAYSRFLYHLGRLKLSMLL